MVDQFSKCAFLSSPENDSGWGTLMDGLEEDDVGATVGCAPKEVDVGTGPGGGGGGTVVEAGGAAGAGMG